MTLEADLFAELKGLTGNRCFPDVAPAGTALPYSTYQQAGGEAITFVDRAVPSKQNGRFTVWVWATTRAAAKALILQAESALTLSTRFQASPLGASISDRDPDTGYYGSRQDFSVWADR